jgi:hypothetical protein
MAETSTVAVEVKVDSKNAEKSVGSIKSRLKEARAELTNAIENFGEFSKEAANAAKSVEGLKGTIDDASRLVAAFDGDKKFAAFGSSISAVASGFTAAQGAIGLFGTESKEVEAALLKVNSAMALSQGINGVLEGVKSFKDLGLVIKSTTVFQKASAAATGIAATVQNLFTKSVDQSSKGFKVLRGAIIATGIGALVVLVGLLIENFDSVKKVIEKLLGPLKGVTDFIGKLVTGFTDFIGLTSEAERETEKLKKATEKSNKAFENQIEIMQAQGATSKEIRKVKNAMYEDELKNLRLILAANGKLKKEESDRFKELQQQQAVLKAEQGKEDKDAADADAKKKLEDAKKASDDAIAEGKKNQEKAKASGDAATQKEIDDFKNKNQTTLELARINGEDVIAIRNKQIDAEIALLKSKGAKFKEGVAALEKEKQISAATAVAQGERDAFDALKLKNEQELELAKLAGQDVVALRGKQIDDEISVLKSKTGNFTEAIASLEREKVVAGAQAEADAKAEVEEAKKLREELAKELQVVTEETELIDLKTKFDAQYAILKGDEVARALLVEKYAKEKADVTKKYSDEIIAQDERERKSKQDSLKAVGDAIGVASDIIGKDTAAGKALAVAQALINTYLGASEVIKAKSTIPEPFGTISKIANVAAIIATGIKSVKAITSVKVPGRGGGGGGASIPSTPITPPVAPQAESTRLDQGQINQIGNASARAFVVESDITGNQEKIRRLNRQARIS